MRKIIQIAIIFLPFIANAQLQWTYSYLNDSNSNYFYTNRGISKNNTTILTTRSLFSFMSGSYYSNFQLIDDISGSLIIDTIDNQSQFSGILNIENTNIGSGFVIGQTYNPSTTFSSDVYHFLSTTGTTNTIISNDSIGKLYELKSYHDTLFCLAEENTVRIKLFDAQGNSLGFIPIDTNNANKKFTPKSFELGPSGIIVFGQKAFNNSLNSQYCIRYVSLQGNLLFEYLTNASSNADEVTAISVNSNYIYFGGKKDLQNGVSGIDLVKIDLNGLFVWDTSLVFQSSQRSITDFSSSNGYLYFALTGFNATMNKYSTNIYSLNESTNQIMSIATFDSLNYSTDIKLTENNNKTIACINSAFNTNSRYKLLLLHPTYYIDFYQYNDSTSSILTYLTTENSNLYFGGSSFLSKFDLTVLSNEEINQSDSMAIYPNPASNQITILIPEMSGNLKYEIFNSVGKTINSGYSISRTIDLQQIESGVYFLLIHNKNKKFINKLIISQ